MYCYAGGMAIDKSQNANIGSLAVRCKNWHWAALAYVAARLFALICSNVLGDLECELMRPDGELEHIEQLQSQAAFHTLCLNMWDEVKRLGENVWNATDMPGENLAERRGSPFSADWPQDIWNIEENRETQYSTLTRVMHAIFEKHQEAITEARQLFQ